ncbi:hypothetical protein [Lapillicoccus sp.]|uniref:hypothetical protein n=1 Tax=Lapillicoccus sp. TaxID=1909287 RepID=UPI003264BE58
MTAWSTPEQIAATRETIAASIEGWQEPVAYAVGLTPATSSAELEFPVINIGEDYHGLPAVILAKTIGYANGTSTHVLSVAELTHAVNGLAPAEACEASEHVNLHAWRKMLTEVESNPYRNIVAVFIADLDDPVTSEADGSLRTQLPA